MDFFKFRKKGDSSPSTPVQPESVERMRQRARHRLIGATVLVLIGVRAAVGAVEVVAAWLLLRGSMSSRPLAIAALAASAVLVPLETGWRLVPTNLDPTYRWWLVGAYWAYALVGIRALWGSRADS